MEELKDEDRLETISDDSEKYLELKINSRLAEIQLFNKEKINFEELEDTLSSYVVYLELVEKQEDSDEEELIATLRGNYFDIDYAWNHGLCLFDIFDMVSGDTNVISNIFFDEEQNLKSEFETDNGNIFYLDRIFVEKNHRNKGYAKLLLNQLDEIVRYILKLNAGIIVVCAQPFEKNNGKEKIIRNDKTLQNKLIKLYEENGFNLVKDLKYKYLFKIIY